MCKPLDLVRHVLGGTGVSESKDFIGRVFRWRVDAVGFAGCRGTISTSIGMNGTGSNVSLALLALVLPLRWLSASKTWRRWAFRSNIIRSRGVIRAIFAEVASLATLITSCMSLVPCKLIGTFFFLVDCRSGSQRISSRWTSFGEGNTINRCVNLLSPITKLALEFDKARLKRQKRLIRNWKIVLG